MRMERAVALAGHNPAPGEGTPGEDYNWTEVDRRALSDLTIAVEQLMTAVRAMARGFPLDHKEVQFPLQMAQLKLPKANAGALSAVT